MFLKKGGGTGGVTKCFPRVYTVRAALLRNITTIIDVNCHFSLDPSCLATKNTSKFTYESEEGIKERKEVIVSLKKEVVEEIYLIIDTLKNKEETIRSLKKMMDEKFTKVWDVPWSLVHIIHSYMWCKEVLESLYSNSSVRYIAFFLRIT